MIGQDTPAPAPERSLGRAIIESVSATSDIMGGAASSLVLPALESIVAYSVLRGHTGLRDS